MLKKCCDYFKLRQNNYGCYRKMVNCRSSKNGWISIKNQNLSGVNFIFEIAGVKVPLAVISSIPLGPSLYKILKSFKFRTKFKISAQLLVKQLRYFENVAFFGPRLWPTMSLANKKSRHNFCEPQIFLIQSLA